MVLQLFIERASNGKGQRRNKGYRRDGAGGRYGSVLGTVNCAVGGVSVRAVAGVEAPEALRIRLHFGRPVQTILAMYFHGICRGDPIVKAELVALIAEIEISGWHLMNEDGTSLERLDSRIGLQGALRWLSQVRLRQGIDWRTEAEQVEQDRLAVGAIVIGYETCFGPPSVREHLLIWSGAIVRQHPPPVDSSIKGVG